jgi:general secretion pathway protein L
VFTDAAGVPRRWRLLSGGAVVGRGDEVAQLPETRPWVRIVMAVPGTDVTLRWLELGEGLAPVQAAAAARLQLAEETADPLGDMHAAAGRPERGMTPIALVPAVRMAAWIESARTLALEPDVVLPTPLLLMPPGEGLVRYAGGEVPDYRGSAQAFSVEDALAAMIVRDAAVAEVDEATREAGLAQVLAAPPINLRQGAFQRRREWAIDWVRVRRMSVYAALLLLVSVAIQLVIITRTTFAADRYAAEARELRQATGPSGARGAAVQARYAPLAGALFGAVRDTPGVELSQMVYQPDGTLRASVLADSSATVDALRTRIGQSGLQAQGDMPTVIGGRTASQITIRRQ